LKDIFAETPQQAFTEPTGWDMEGDLIIPGLIDTHVHGAGGCDVMDCTPESLQTLAEALLKEGKPLFYPS
jgi:N-acetylglucosamine-6-phosphate deacetylase